MKKYVFVLYLLFIFTGVLFGCLLSDKIEISGNINKQDFFDLKDTYIILVPIDKLQLQMNIVEGKLIAIEYADIFPKKEIRTSGNFKYNLEKLPAGHYIIGLNKLLPKFEVKYRIGDPEKYFSRAFFNEQNEPIIIEIKNDIVPPLKIDLGNVVIPLIRKDIFFDNQFKGIRVSYSF